MPPLNKAMIAGGTTNAKRLHLRNRRLLHPQNVSQCPIICCLVVEPAISKKCQGLLGIITCLGKSWVTFKTISFKVLVILDPSKTMCVWSKTITPKKKVCGNTWGGPKMGVTPNRYSMTMETSRKLGSQRVGRGFVAMVKLVEQPKHKGLNELCG